MTLWYPLVTPPVTPPPVTPEDSLTPSSAQRAESEKQPSFVSGPRVAPWAGSEGLQQGHNLTQATRSEFESQTHLVRGDPKLR